MIIRITIATFILFTTTLNLTNDIKVSAIQNTHQKDNFIIYLLQDDISKAIAKHYGEIYSYEFSNNEKVEIIEDLNDKYRFKIKIKITTVYDDFTKKTTTVIGKDTLVFGVSNINNLQNGTQFHLIDYLSTSASEK